MAEQKEILAEQGLEGPLCYDKRIYVTALSKAERLKHNQYIQKDMARDEVGSLRPDTEVSIQTFIYFFLFSVPKQHPRRVNSGRCTLSAVDRR